MSKQAKCNLILKRMRDAGYSDVVDTCDGWTDEEVDYFLANYESHYLTKEEI